MEEVFDVFRLVPWYARAVYAIAIFLTIFLSVPKIRRRVGDRYFWWIPPALALIGGGFAAGSTYSIATDYDVIGSLAGVAALLGSTIKMFAMGLVIAFALWAYASFATVFVARHRWKREGIVGALVVIPIGLWFAASEHLRWYAVATSILAYLVLVPPILARAVSGADRSTSRALASITGLAVLALWTHWLGAAALELESLYRSPTIAVRSHFHAMRAYWATPFLTALLVAWTGVVTVIARRARTDDVVRRRAAIRIAAWVPTLILAGAAATTFVATEHYLVRLREADVFARGHALELPHVEGAALSLERDGVVVQITSDGEVDVTTDFAKRRIPKDMLSEPKKALTTTATDDWLSVVAAVVDDSRTELLRTRQLFGTQKDPLYLYLMVEPEVPAEDVAAVVDLAGPRQMRSAMVGRTPIVEEPLKLREPYDSRLVVIGHLYSGSKEAFVDVPASTTCEELEELAEQSVDDDRPLRLTQLSGASVSDIVAVFRCGRGLLQRDGESAAGDALHALYLPVDAASRK